MKIDHVHFYVEDAKIWRDWFVSHLGFQAVTDDFIPPNLTKSNLGESFDSYTEIVKSGEVCFLLSSPLLPTSPVAEFLRLHPPGVADVAFAVEDVEKAMADASSHNAKILQPIQKHEQGDQYLKWSKIAAWGSLTHTLIERGHLGEGTRDKGTREALRQGNKATSPTAIDHIVLNVAAGDLEDAVAWYENVLDFQPQQAFKIKTDRSALYSRVMLSRNGNIQIPINEPASPNSQIQEFLDVNRGAGIQHIALQTPNLVQAIAQFRHNGLSLLPVPNTYYSQLKQREKLPLSLLELEAIALQEILVDWKEDNLKGLLLQIFTQPIFGEPTFFFEFIERRSQAQGFGEGNFRALFEAIEKEQIKRGSLQ